MNYYQQGEAFVITMEPTLYTCTSCRRFLQSLISKVEQDGKSLTIEVIANPNIENKDQLQTYLAENNGN